jgi:hypothetical protein
VMTVTVERKGWRLSNLDRCKEERTAIARSSVSVWCAPLSLSLSLSLSRSPARSLVCKYPEFPLEFPLSTVCARCCCWEADPPARRPARLERCFFAKISPLPSGEPVGPRTDALHRAGQP